jgi:MFS family permease
MPSSEPTAARPRRESQSSFAPFAVRDFRLLFLSFVGWQLIHPLQVVSLIFWVQDNADDETRILLIGVLGSLRGMGALVFSLIAGALADRFDRRLLLLAAQGLGFGIALTVALLMSVGSGDALGFALIFLLAFLSAAPIAIDMPTRQAMVPEIVGPRLTSRGIALNSAGMQLAMPLAIFGVGLVIEAVGTGGAYALSSAGHALAFLLLLPMSYRTAARGRAAGATLRRTVADIAAGFRFARGQAIVLWVIVLVVVLLGIGFPPTASLGPTWVTTVVGATYAEFGFIALTWGVGALLASLAMTRVTAVRLQGPMVSLGALTFAGSFVLFVAGQTWPFAVAGNFGLGAGFAITQVAATSLIAHHTPNEVRGRVMSLLMIGIFAAQSLALPVAVAGQMLSLETLFPILSYVCLGSVAALLLARRELWRTRAVPGDARPQSMGGRRGR